MDKVNAIDYWYKKYLKEKLTCEDIQLIIQLGEEVMSEAGGTPKDYNEEILKRFNETKSKK